MANQTQPPVQQALNFEGAPLTHEQQFALWKERPGAKHVLRDFYRLAAGYVGQWKKTGIPVSATLVFELLRHRLKHVHDRAVRKEVKADSLDGYSLPNNIRPYLSRHVMEHRPQWKGLFETRAVGVDRSKRRIIIIEKK